MRRVVTLLLFALFVGAGLGTVRLLIQAGRKEPPPMAAVITQVREVARLETLDVTLYKKISLMPDPALSGSLWQDVLPWARYALRPPHGTAIVFAEAHVGVDLSLLDADRIWVEGRNAYVNLPPLRVAVELKPGDTEIIDSNLDSAQTAQLFELAREAFSREVAADAKLNERARASAERAVRGLLHEIGFTNVYFVDRSPTRGPS